MILQNLSTDAQSLLLIILLVVAFVVAFKIMEMIFETILVSALSAVFYLALSYFFGFPLALDRILLFAFLGATLYMGYSFLASAYTIASMLIGIPYRVAKVLWSVVVVPLERLHAESKHLWTGLSEKAGEIERKRKKEDFSPDSSRDTDDSEEDDEEDRDVKEVVLSKVKDEDEDED